MGDIAPVEQPIPISQDQAKAPGKFSINPMRLLNGLRAMVKPPLAPSQPEENLTPKTSQDELLDAAAAGDQDAQQTLIKNTHQALREGWEKRSAEKERGDWYEQVMAPAIQRVLDDKANDYTHVDQFKPSSFEAPLSERGLMGAIDALGKVIIPPNLLKDVAVNATDNETGVSMTHILQEMAEKSPGSLVEILVPLMKQGPEGYTVADTLARQAYQVDEPYTPPSSGENSKIEHPENYRDPKQWDIPNALLPILNHPISKAKIDSILSDQIPIPTIATLITPQTQEEADTFLQKVSSSRVARSIVWQLLHPTESHHQSDTPEHDSAALWQKLVNEMHEIISNKLQVPEVPLSNEQEAYLTKMRAMGVDERYIQLQQNLMMFLNGANQHYDSLRHPTEQTKEAVHQT